VTQVETALERNLSEAIMHGDREPEIRKLPEGETLTEQGEEATELYLLLDGVLSVEVDGEALAKVGPGAIVGERALLEQKRRTSTLRAATRCKVAVVSAAEIDEGALAQVASGHRREEEPETESQ
jgi:CRP-like cAMP-binding protein